MRLPNAGQRAYAYAKACGIIGRSFVGRRVPRLAAAGRLSELDRLVFPDSNRELPERELLPDMERRFTERAAASISAIVECFPRPPEFLVLLLRAYEYADLKSALSVLSGSRPGGPGASPSFTRLGRFQTVNFGAWPDLAAMVKGTEFESFLEDEGFGPKADASSKDTGDISLQTALDRLYYQRLWKALFDLPRSDRRETGKILAAEISLRNAAWTLRLRTYYRMQKEEIKIHLVSAGGKGRPVISPEDAPLDLPLDSRAEWKGWRWERLLNPGESGEWTADPRYFQNTAAKRLYTMALHSLRLRPFSMDAIFCFIKLKQFEEDLLTSAAEGIGLGMSIRDVFSVMEVQA
ncbi:MAG: V-type ATPase subunit [Treponema sp.]|jgi:vacuolar-type H+-ATPase subunit C/Vma6|nr:V-type ATPase subunit [Treponema sp.]